MNDQQIRQLVREEVARMQQSARFNLNVNPRVTHTGIDAAPINAGNLAPGLKTFGRITMSEARDYKFNVGFRPSLVTFFGTPYHNPGTGIDIHTFLFGQAALGQNLALQPDGTSGVKTGGKFEIVQGSTVLGLSGSGNTSTFAGTNDENHIINVDLGGGTLVRATIKKYSPSGFTVTVDQLNSGWTIIGNWFVS